MKFIIIICSIIISANLPAQELNFKSNIGNAKKSYAAGNLEDAHFALQQSMQELDIVIGKEVLKLLPQKMGDAGIVTAEDNVTGNVSFIGATIHRSYTTPNKKVMVEIINNSPMVGALNTFLTNPLLAGMGSDGKSKVLKVQGYKSRLTKEDNSEDATKIPYKMEIPFSNALVTFTSTNSSESEMIALANTIPFDQIAKLIQ